MAAMRLWVWNAFKRVIHRHQRLVGDAGGVHGGETPHHLISGEALQAVRGGIRLRPPGCVRRASSSSRSSECAQL